MVQKKRSTRTKESLSKSREFNRAVLMSMRDHIAVLDKAGNILSVNKSWLDFASRNAVGSPEVIGEGINYLEVCRRASVCARLSPCRPTNATRRWPGVESRSRELITNTESRYGGFPRGLLARVQRSCPPCALCSSGGRSMRIRSAYFHFRARRMPAEEEA